MNEKRALLNHFLAALAYRTQKALRDAPADFGSFTPPAEKEQLLQGPFSDAMTHAGQLTMLRRFAGSPVAPENFIVAEIKADKLGPDQSKPNAPDKVWPESPKDWKPPSQ